MVLTEIEYRKFSNVLTLTSSLSVVVDSIPTFALPMNVTFEFKFLTLSII